MTDDYPPLVYVAVSILVGILSAFLWWYVQPWSGL